MYSADPNDVFSISAVINEDDELGTVLWGTVQDRWVSVLACSKVTIRLVCLGEVQEAHVRHIVSHVSRAASREEWKAAYILPFIGVWRSLVGETWIVSERINTAVSLRQLLYPSVPQRAPTKKLDDLESFVWYVVQRVVNILHWLHSQPRMVHGYVTLGSVYACDDGSIWLGDVGIYDALCDCLRSRQTFPGEKAWARSGAEADLSDLGVVVAMIVEGPVAVSRMWRAGWKAPRVGSGSRELGNLNGFLSQVFTAPKILSTSTCDTQGASGLEYAWNLPLVRDASDGGCRTLVQEYWKQREETTVLSDGHTMGLIGRLFRQNEVVVRAPLINVDDLSSEWFEYERWIGNDINRPTAEQALVRVVKSCKERALTRDVEDVKNRRSLVNTLETFVNTADML